MRWLHISDIHVGRPGPTGQRVAIDSLVDALAVTLENIHLDAVILSGDLAYSGKDTEYDNFADNLVRHLKALPAATGAQIFATPGNHDINTADGSPISWDILGSRRQAMFFEESPEGRETRRHRAQVFAGYSRFLEKYAIRGVDPLKNVSKLDLVESQDHPFQIATTNTALFCDTDSDYREKIPTPDTSLRTVLRSSPRSMPLLIVGHHPIDWFLPNSRNPFKQLLLTNHAIYLHGHAHELDVQFGPNGVESIGFGAAYAKLPGQPGYRNCFAICDLTTDLIIAPYHWDDEFGRWVPTTTLPHAFQKRSALLENGWCLNVARAAGSSVLGMPAMPHPKLNVNRFLSATHLSAADWRAFIIYAGLLPKDIGVERLVSTASSLGECAFEYTLPAGRHYVRCISGAGSHLSRPQVEDFNTTLDTEGYQSVTILSLGTISDDASTTYLRLKTRKAITVLTASELAARVSTIGSFSAVVGQLDSAIADCEFSLSEGGLPLLVVSECLRATWFYVVGPDGTELEESDPRVAALRKVRSHFASASYRHSQAGQRAADHSVPIRHEYLKSCQDEFSAVRYAPLAAVGLRLPGISLEDLYVETGAQVGSDTSPHGELDRALRDLLSSAQIDGVLREELLRGTKGRVHDQTGLEHNSARALYQQFGSLVVLGDPGSGKTCFVKRELLAYCSGTPTSWYGRHYPLYVSLAELAAISDGSLQVDVLALASELARRRGLRVHASQAKELFSKGLLAIFLDGLDEIVSVERRATILSEIKTLIDLGLPFGNRFILTSRPAAINRIELSKDIHLIHMRGLTDSEMRSLAERILAARVSESAGSLRLDLQKLTQADQSVLDQLLADCAREPGIDRLARNPLFLTLLVMIYANSGSASARRHRVYQQAVNTLVSIRARDAGQRGLAEADLRRRLGAVALSVFEDPQGALPSLDGVIMRVRTIMATERGKEVERSEVEGYLQDVGEATGLLVFHRALPSHQPGSVTFMHHSFLEYYAAIGLSATAYGERLQGLARIPRWRDVLTLLAGIVGDTSDVSPLIDALLAAPNAIESITLDTTLLAIDCALESDVPPDRVMRALLRRVEDVIASGPLMYDADLREKFGEKLALLFQFSGTTLIDKFFIDGLSSVDDRSCAAYVDILGHVASMTTVRSEVISAFDLAAGKRAPVVSRAVCDAAGRAEGLRSPAAIVCISNSLQGSKPVRVAAAKALAKAPSLGKDLLENLSRSVAKESADVAGELTMAILKIGVPIEKDNGRTIEILTAALSRIPELTNLGSDTSLAYALSDVEPFLDAQNGSVRLTGIRLLAWVVEDEIHVRDRLIHFIENGNREEKVAALTSIRINEKAPKILTKEQGTRVWHLLSAENSRDVQIATARLLATVASNDTPSVNRLIEFVESSRGTEVFVAAVSILGWIADEQDECQAFLLNEAEVMITSKKSQSPQNIGDLEGVLDALDGVDCQGSERLVHRLADAISDYKVDIRIRRAALYAYAWIADVESATLRFIKLLRSPPTGLFGNVAAAVQRFVGRSRKRIEYVRAIHPNLEALQQALTDYYRRAIGATGTDGDLFVPAVRSALLDIHQMLNSYREFSERQAVRQVPIEYGSTEKSAEEVAVAR